MFALSTARLISRSTAWSRSLYTKRQPAHSDTTRKRKAQRSPSKHTTQPGKRHTLLHVGCPPQKAVAALVRYRRTQWCLFSATQLWTGVQLAGCAAPQRHTELWHHWTLILSKLCQLQKLVLTACSGAIRCSQALLQNKSQKLAS